MEEDKLKELFRTYNPQLTDDFRFMTRLRQRLDSVESVRRDFIVMKRRTRRAVIAAAIAGFIAGFLSSYLVPYLTDRITALGANINSVEIGRGITERAYLISWVILGTLTILVSLRTYSFALSPRIYRPGK